MSLKTILKQTNLRKYVTCSNVVPALVMSILCVLSLHIRFATNKPSGESVISGRYWENYFEPFSALDLILLILFCVLWAVIFVVIKRFYRRKSIVLFRLDSSRKIPVVALFFIALGCILICWLPYMLSWFPGGIYSDTNLVVRYSRSDFATWTNRHTLLYAFFWWICTRLAFITGNGSVELSAAYMTIFQVLFFASCFAWMIVKFYKWNFKTVVICLLIAFFSLFPAFPLFAISLWKDVFFTGFLVLLSIQFVSMIVERDVSIGRCISIPILLLLVAYLRNNGVYISAATLIAMFLICKKLSIKGYNTTIIASSILMFVTIVVQGPVYSMLGIETPFSENIGIPLQQIAAAMVYGHLTPEQTDFLSKILPTQYWIENYRPFLVDNIKWSTEYNETFLNDHKFEFFTTYLSIGLSNPLIYLKAFFMANAGYWDPFLGTTENVAHFQPMMWDWPGYKQWDPIDMATGTSIREILWPKLYPSEGLFVWIMLIATFAMWTPNKKAPMLLNTPSLILLLTLIVGAPIAYSLRYIFIVVALMPLYVLLPALVNKHNAPLSLDAK